MKEAIDAPLAEAPVKVTDLKLASFTGTHFLVQTEGASAIHSAYEA